MPESTYERTLRRLPRPLRAVAEVLGDTVTHGGENDLALFAPAMAYALTVSLAPLTVALSLLASYLAAPDYLRTSPLAQVEINVDMLFGGLAWAGPAASVIAILLVIYGASALFGQLSQAIHRIWRQPGGPQGVRVFVRTHLFALLLLVVAALALFVSAVLGNVLAGVVEVVVNVAAGVGIDLGWLDALIRSRLLVDFGFAALLLLITFTIVPRIRPRVRDVLPGVLITAVAYALGQAVLTTYLSSATRFTALGAFGAFLGFLVWVYYTAVIVLWGAQLTYEIARRKACRRGGADTEPYACGEVEPATGRSPEAT